MEPFTTFATVASVAALTLQAIKALNYDVQAIKGAPFIVEQLKQDLDAIAGVLQTLRCKTDGSLLYLNTDANAVLVAALENCQCASDGF
jgi:hypothetical protein